MLLLFRSGGANKAERSDALGAAVEVKPVPKTIGDDKFSQEQIRQRPAGVDQTQHWASFICSRA
jgi:hypothetical protein